MPRVKASPKKCVKPTNSQSSSNWVFLLKGNETSGLCCNKQAYLRNPDLLESDYLVEHCYDLLKKS